MEPIDIRPIPHLLAKPWILYRHYAHRMPPVSFAVGLFINNQHEGVCTFGPPPRNFNNGAHLFQDLEVTTYELNRLVIGDGLPPNTLSRFVVAALACLETPAAVVSYADPNAGHHGYIYQATNWLYLGETQAEIRYTNTNTGDNFHARSVVSMLGTRTHDTLPDWVETGEQLGKHRYLMLLGSKTQRKTMRKRLTYSVEPYPKGDNQQYEPGHVASQGVLSL